AQELPEIKRLDLSGEILMRKAAGVEDLMQFRWLEAPNDTALNHAEELLLDLGALEREGAYFGTEEQLNPVIRDGGTIPGSIVPPSRITTISELGRRMLAFPLHPRYSRMLLAAHEYGCVYHACLVAALTQGRDLLLR